MEDPFQFVPRGLAARRDGESSVESGGVAASRRAFVIHAFSALAGLCTTTLGAHVACADGPTAAGTGQGYGPLPNRTHGRRMGTSAAPHVRPAAPVVSGTLRPNAVIRVALRNLGQVEHCQQQGIALDPNTRGRVVLRFTIDASGLVRQSVISANTLSITSVADCIARAVMRWTFPAAQSNTTTVVSYPFDLLPAE